MGREWEPDGAGGFIQRGSVWTHKAAVKADGLEFVATEHRGTDYFVLVPVEVVRALLEAWDTRSGSQPVAVTTTLWRPVGQEELDLVEKTAWTRFPKRLEGQPFLYPVCTERYAHEIAERWNTRAGGTGFVLRFTVNARFLERYRRQVVGRSYHEEYWIPADDLEDFNDSIVGPIEIIARYGPKAS